MGTAAGGVGKEGVSGFSLAFLSLPRLSFHSDVTDVALAQPLQDEGGASSGSQRAVRARAGAAVLSLLCAKKRCKISPVKWTCLHYSPSPIKYA